VSASSRRPRIWPPRPGTVVPESRPDPGPHWTVSAACAQADPEVFFPVAGRFGSDEAVKAAKGVCAGCPVRRECLEYALGNGEAHGIWGGATPAEREKMRGGGLGVAA
jgi:WhiB family redox-sensing transcriptional regulator